MSAPREFAGRDREYDFALGTIKGLRTWSADDQGRLRGVTYPVVWTPGENISRCMANDRDCGQPGCGFCAALAASAEAPRHNFDPECDCGFWAYDERNVKPHGDCITGVIEGYGRVTIGTKGFRCEKAKIVALSRADSDGDPMSLSLWLRLQQLYAGVEFHDEYDAMVAAHGQVLRDWDPVSEGFWDVPESQQRPAPPGLAGLFSAVQAHSRQISAAMVPVVVHGHDPKPQTDPPAASELAADVDEDELTREEPTSWWRRYISGGRS